MKFPRKSKGNMPHIPTRAGTPQKHQKKKMPGKGKSLPREEVRQASNLIGDWEEEYHRSTSSDTGRRSASLR